jgi:hypothetical protein
LSPTHLFIHTIKVCPGGALMGNRRGFRRVAFIAFGTLWGHLSSTLLRNAFHHAFNQPIEGQFLLVGHRLPFGDAQLVGVVLDGTREAPATISAFFSSTRALASSGTKLAMGASSSRPSFIPHHTGSFVQVPFITFPTPSCRKRPSSRQGR